jgi:hypothetical protein
MFYNIFNMFKNIFIKIYSKVYLLHTPLASLILPGGQIS